MKSKLSFLMLTLTFSGLISNAQLLDKLKERAKEKGLETREVSYDTTLNEKNKTYTEGDGLQIKSAKDFFNKDVVMALYNNGILTQTSYFDKETIAMRTEQEGKTKPVYHDDKGKFYGYNDSKGYYETMKLLPTSSMGFMTAGMTTQVYRLPQEPYFEAFGALEEIGSGLNFIILEMAFIYKPIHFENDSNYSKQSITCHGTISCTRYNYNDPEYRNSYIQFDEQERLNELYIDSSNPQFEDQPKGKFVFTYKDCSVKLPDAVEQSMVPGPLGKIIPLEKGLEPWKYNKKDKQ